MIFLSLRVPGWLPSNDNQLTTSDAGLKQAIEVTALLATKSTDGPTKLGSPLLGRVIAFCNDTAERTCTVTSQKRPGYQVLDRPSVQRLEQLFRHSRQSRRNGTRVEPSLPSPITRTTSRSESTSKGAG
jgi:hypothetical protein